MYEVGHRSVPRIGSLKTTGPCLWVCTIVFLGCPVEHSPGCPKGVGMKEEDEKRRVAERDECRGRDPTVHRDETDRG